MGDLLDLWREIHGAKSAQSPVSQIASTAPYRRALPRVMRSPQERAVDPRLAPGTRAQARQEMLPRRGRTNPLIDLTDLPQQLENDQATYIDQLRHPERNYSPRLGVLGHLPDRQRNFIGDITGLNSLSEGANEFASGGDPVRASVNTGLGLLGLTGLGVASRAARPSILVREALPRVADDAPRFGIPNPPARELGYTSQGGVLPVSPASPFRNSLRGGSSDLMDAANGVMAIDRPALPRAAGADVSLQPDAVLTGGHAPRTITAYHYTTQPIDGAFREGTYFSTNPRYAQLAMTDAPQEGAQIHRVELNIQNPYYVSEDEAARFINGSRVLMDEARRAGHDALIYRHPTNLGDEIVPLQQKGAKGDTPEITSSLGRADLPRRAGTADDMQPDAVQGIRAYHGSPHDFDKFSLDHIGSGEGAQAYGHGLYFAENEGVAADYRRRLAGIEDIAEFRLGGLRLTPRNNFDYSPRGSTNYENIRSSLAEDALIHQADLAADPARAQQYVLQLLDDRIKNMPREWPEGLPDAMQLRSDLSRPGAISLRLGEQPGRMYEVNLNAEPEQFLDWDTPLSGQPRPVRQNVAQAIAGGDPLVTELLGDLSDPGSMQMAGLFPQSRGSQVYNTLTDANKETVTQHLRDAGIPGIRYLDQGSRSAGEGSRNYVVFDPKIIEILRKYGLAGLGVTGAGAVQQNMGDGEF